MTTMEFVEAELAKAVELSVFIDGVADIVEMTEADAIALRDALNKMFPPVVQHIPMHIQLPHTIVWKLADGRIVEEQTTVSDAKRRGHYK